jgi:hypothetical protein
LSQAGHEGDDALGRRADAGGAGDRIAPPPLGAEEGLLERAEGLLPPAGMGEAMIGRAGRQFG